MWASLICNHKDLSFRIFSEQIFEEVNEDGGIDSLRWNLKKQSTSELNLAVSVPTLWRELKKLKLSCQKPERRALEQDPKARARWIATEWPRIKRLARKQRALVFFEDESVVRLTPTVGRTWAPVGKTPIVRVTGKRASVLVMSALSLQR